MGSLTILNTTKPNPPLLCSPLSPPPLQEFKFPTKSQRPFSSTVKFRATPLKSCAFPSSNSDNGSGEKDDCLSSGRALLVCISTLPFQFGPHEPVDDFDAKATQQV